MLLSAVSAPSAVGFSAFLRAARMTINRLTQRSVGDLSPKRVRFDAPPLGYVLLFGAALIFALACASSLWAAYGTTVFFETLRIGFLMACFG